MASWRGVTASCTRYLASYARAMRCPVPSSLRERYAMSGTEMVRYLAPYARATRCPVLRQCGA
eukprot:45564-Rhodomonas_salina.2